MTRSDRKKFINNIINFFVRIKGMFVRFNEIMKIPREDKEGEINTYQAFTHWLLDVFQYGLILEIIHITLTSWHGWKTLLWVLALGLAWWIILEFIGEVKKKLKE